ncbi:MAG: TetR/AcrR family transcriptional regulator [Clostridiales bacterium]|nr:TetR/AcrR family transcriptional regulator [Clostridiales bacterium]
MSNSVRVPQQERSIEKKNKIIQAGYELFSEVGYYGTNTVEIAKRAGVSTGIVYGYFQDKRDILICVLEIYIDRVYQPLSEIMAKASIPVDINALAMQLLNKTIELHEQNAKLHNTLHSLATTDEVVNAQFISLENKITEQMTNELRGLRIDVPSLIEKVHLAMNVIQSFAHEVVFDSHSYIDYSEMKHIVCKIIVELFK